MDESGSGESIHSYKRSILIIQTSELRIWRMSSLSCDVLHKDTMNSNVLVIEVFDDVQVEYGVRTNLRSPDNSNQT